MIQCQLNPDLFKLFFLSSFFIKTVWSQPTLPHHSCRIQFSLTLISVSVLQPCCEQSFFNYFFTLLQFQGRSLTVGSWRKECSDGSSLFFNPALPHLDNKHLSLIGLEWSLPQEQDLQQRSLQIIGSHCPSVQLLLRTWKQRSEAVKSEQRRAVLHRCTSLLCTTAWK